MNGSPTVDCLESDPHWENHHPSGTGTEKSMPRPLQQLKGIDGSSEEQIISDLPISSEMLENSPRNQEKDEGNNRDE